MGNVKMANITSNISTMLLRLLFSTAKHMSSQGTNFNYEYETIRIVLVIIVDPGILYELNC